MFVSHTLIGKPGLGYLFFPHGEQREALQPVAAQAEEASALVPHLHGVDTSQPLGTEPPWFTLRQRDVNLGKPWQC